MFLKWFGKGVNMLITIWIGISFLILICNSLFWINDFIARPQHGIFEHFDSISRIIKEEGKQFWYRAYFILDFFWALYFLIIIGSLCKDAKGIPLIDYKRSKTPASYIFLIFALAAFLFDCLEGMAYWTYNSTLVPYFYYMKLIGYLVCLMFLMYWLLKSYLLPNLKSILRFIGTSALSIIFIIIIYGLITMMPQGGTIIVELFYKPLNIVIFFFMITFLAIIISHFPVYVDIWMNGDNSCVELKMAKRSSFLGFGIIYYHTLKSNNEKSQTYQDVVVKSLRRILGILLYVAVFNIFFGVISRFFEKEFNAGLLTLFVMVLTLFVYYLEGERYVQWKRKLRSDNEQVQENMVKDIVKYVHRFLPYFICCSLGVIVSSAVAYLFEWSKISIIVFLIVLGCQMYLYIQFKIARTFFKYVYCSEELATKRKNMYNPETLATFKKFHPIINSGSTRRFRFLGKLSDNVSYLTLMRLSGIVSLGFIIVANLNFEFATYLNPLNIILLYIVFFYSIIVLTFKHILYYQRLPKESSKKRNFFQYGIPLILLLIFVLFSYTTTLKNDLHQLQMVNRTQPVLEYDEFLKSMTNGATGPGKHNYFFIGSYGGGLKANLWNLLLLDELERQSNREFLSRTLVMSGVSGGAVGIGNYTALVHEGKDSLKIARSIDEIGNSNVLSNELTYLLGKDWLREYLPFVDHKGQDRSYRSMQHHAELTGMKKYNSIGYADYWHNVYKGQGRKFPALIMNTTAVGGHQGVASTVKFPENTFAGADNIVDFEGDLSNMTLTYFGAVSTTNRFPIFSPTAKILTKGSYLDGGYFENSGLLSAVEVYDAVIRDSMTNYRQKINPVFINIINSEEYYIAQKIVEYGIRLKNYDDTSEMGSILGTVTSIDKLPRYVLEKIKARDFAVEPIMMPHKLSYEKVRDVLNGDIVDPVELMEIIKAHNDTIDQALKAYRGYAYKKWGVVQPPLARILSKPAVQYQKAMVKHHPSIKNALERILFYTKTEEIISNQYQKSLKNSRAPKNIKLPIYLQQKKKRDSLRIKRVK